MLKCASKLVSVRRQTLNNGNEPKYNETQRSNGGLSQCAITSTMSLIMGQEMPFIVKGLDLHAKCSTTVAITGSLFERSHAHHAQSHSSPRKC